MEYAKRIDDKRKYLEILNEIEKTDVRNDDFNNHLLLIQNSLRRLLKVDLSKIMYIN